MKPKKNKELSPKQIKIMQDAMALHQSGQLDAAEAQYKKLLQSFPGNIDFLNDLAMISFQKGKLEEGIQIIGRSLLLNSNQPQALNNKGNALKELGRFDEALDSYARAIALKSDYAFAYSNSGLVLKKLGRLEEAVTSYQHAISINSSYPEAYYNCGLVLEELKRFDEALVNYDRAIAIKPDYAAAYSSRGNLLQDLKRLDEALQSYNSAIFNNKRDPEVYYNRGLALQGLKRFDEALENYDTTIYLNPNYAEAYSNRGNTLQELKRIDEAVVNYDRAISLKPDYAEAYSNLGNALQELKKFEEAVVNYDQAILLKPDYAEAYSNRGKALQELKKFDGAIENYDTAIKINPTFADAYWNKSILKILQGEFLEGWLLYEWRWKSDLGKPLRHFRSSLWLGQEIIENKSLLIYAEQGLGDTIQFIRYAKLAEQLGAHVILELPSEFIKIASTLAGQFTLIEMGKVLPESDYHCPLMSLPLAFKTTVETIPNEVPYLYADIVKKNKWQKRIGNKAQTRIGLVWSGSIAHKNDHNRSIPFEKIATLLKLPIELHCLQKEIRTTDQIFISSNNNIIIHTEFLSDFSDTAALIDEMDLVISVDTSVAHLAGALGKDVWILLPYVPDYRWMLNRADCPWYPSAKLFRQSDRGDWDGVIRQIENELLSYCKL